MVIPAPRKWRGPLPKPIEVKGSVSELVLDTGAKPSHLRAMSKELVDLLLDPAADLASRDDAAMDLGGTEYAAALEALAAIATVETAPELLQESAGE